MSAEAKELIQINARGLNGAVDLATFFGTVLGVSFKKTPWVLTLTFVAKMETWT